MLIDDYEMIKDISLLLILFSVTIIVLAIFVVYSMPEKIARSQNHPQVEAIKITSLLGLLVFPLWIVALIWAYIKPVQTSYPEKTDEKDSVLVDNTGQPKQEAEDSSQEEELPDLQAEEADSDFDEFLEESEYLVIPTDRI